MVGKNGAVVCGSLPIQISEWNMIGIGGERYAEGRAHEGYRGSILNLTLHIHVK